MQQVVPHREEPLLDGNAQSVRYGEISHDGPGQLDSVNFHVKSTSPDTENQDKNGYVKVYNNKNFITTNVDNSDTKYTNTNGMHKHDARDLHK